MGTPATRQLNQQRVFDYVARFGPTTKATLMEALGLPEQATSRHLRHYIATGQMQVERRASRSGWVYRVNSS